MIPYNRTIVKWEVKKMLELRNERIKRGLSLTGLTVLTGIASSDLSRLERGLCPAYPGWKSRIAKAFDMPEEKLFQEVEQDARNH
jgi:transcriptional regulator with XRE-family HTH domain